MIELVPSTDIKKVQTYIEEKENVKLILKKQNVNEIQKGGHPPHYDTGYSNHMKWCRYSASTLLTKEYEGGEFVFVDDDDNDIRTITKDEHYMKTLVFDVGNKHKVNPHSNGDRKVNLYFWESVTEIEPPQCVKNYIEKINQEQLTKEKKKKGNR